MFLVFTPFTFLFLLIYFCFFFVIFTVSNFYIYWIYIEILILLFIGIMYTIFTSCYSQLIIYFLIQTVASFNILVFYINNIPLLFSIALFLNLAIFPFFSWYINILFRFPNFPLFFVSTFHNVPPLLLFFQFINLFNVSFLLASILFTFIYSGMHMLTVSNVRYLLVVSSVGNSGWFLISLFSSSILVFLLFFITYSVSLYLIIYMFNNIANVQSFLSSINLSKQHSLFLLIANLAGVPPMPMFFLKVLLLWYLTYSFVFSFNILVVFVLANVFITISYFQCIIKFFTNSFSAPNNFYIF